MTVELLYFEGCPSYEELLPRLQELLDQAVVGEELELRRVDSAEDAERERFLGSPTVRVRGEDIEPGADARSDFGLKCRLYRTDEGLSRTPPDELILAALDR